MKEFIRKLIGRLKERENHYRDEAKKVNKFPKIRICRELQMRSYSTAIKIVNKLAEEYNNGWIPCSERLPEEHDSIFAKYKGTDKWKEGMFEKTSDRVLVSAQSDGGKSIVFESSTTDGKWRDEERRGCKVTAWQPLPEPCKEGEPV